MNIDELDTLAEVDWQGLVLLLSTHCRLAYIANAKVFCNAQHLRRLSRGDTQQPKFNVGVRLLKLGRKWLTDEQLREVIS